MSTSGAIIAAIGIGAVSAFLFKRRNTTVWGTTGDGEDMPLLPFPESNAPGQSSALETGALAIAELESHSVRETPGPPANDGPIEKYFEFTTRLIGGEEVLTGFVVGWDWCAAAVTWCVALASGMAGVPTPIPARIAVWEIALDARANGILTPIEEATEEDYATGAIVLCRRNGSNPLDGSGHAGHCGFLVGVKRDTSGQIVAIMTLDPNSGEGWALNDRLLSGSNGAVALVRYG